CSRRRGSRIRRRSKSWGMASWAATIQPVHAPTASRMSPNFTRNAIAGGERTSATPSGADSRPSTRLGTVRATGLLGAEGRDMGGVVRDGRVVRSESSGLVTVLAFAGIVVSLSQTLVIPLLGMLPEIADTTPSNAAWVVTSTLLTAAVAVPVLGRL